MKIIFTIIIFAAAVLAVGGLYYMSTTMHVTLSQSSFKEIRVGPNILMVEVADTETKQTQGLSGRAALQEGGGMLFVFPQEGLWGIWMKDMKFSIDIIWMDEGGTVISLRHDISPDSYPEVFQPARPARYVLEVSGGYTASHGIAEGDTFQL